MSLLPEHKKQQMADQRGMAVFLVDWAGPAQTSLHLDSWEQQELLQT